MRLMRPSLCAACGIALLACLLLPASYRAAFAEGSKGGTARDTRPRHRKTAPAPSPGQNTATVALSPAWEVPVPGTSAPFVTGAEGGFVVATRSGRVSAHAPGGVEATWQVDLGAPVETAPVSLSGRLALTTRTGETTELVLLDAATGAVVARQPAGRATPILSAIPAGLAMADPSSGSSSLSLFDPATGALRWKTPLTTAPSVAAAQCDEAIVVGCADGSLVSLGAMDGAPRWDERIGETITTPALCEGRRAWVGSADNRLHALRLGRRGCHRRWSYLTGGDVSGRIVLHGGRVLFFSYDTYLYALESGNGHLAWKVRLGRRPQSDSVLIDDLLMVAPLNTERLEAFHLPDGAQAAALALPGGKDRFVTPPARAGGLVVIAAARYGEESSRIVGLDPAAARKTGPTTDHPAAPSSSGSPP